MAGRTVDNPAVAIDEVVTALNARHFDALVVENSADALAKVKELIPPGATVMTGASKTLQQIGFIDYLKDGGHGWNNLQNAIVAEKDRAKQLLLRKQSTICDYYLGSVHAITKTGELVIASASGSQLPPLAYTAQNLILVVGVQKLVPTLSDAITRIEEDVFPQEDARIRGLGLGHSLFAKLLVLRQEHPIMGRKVRVVIVKEVLGF